MVRLIVVPVWWGILPGSDPFRRCVTGISKPAEAIITGVSPFLKKADSGRQASGDSQEVKTSIKTKNNNEIIIKTNFVKTTVFDWFLIAVKFIDD